ncbi:MAG TPA: adenylate/guanylate cyclase domain-containing protein [Bradyrhizobium sp.]|nr:adenylate/guanylate cyclase domain-containing protein [Bradyrhizobium sp.]
MERRLAAILAADVAGYSRLMEKDEERTHIAFRICHSVIAELVATHGGRIFGGAGDSAMAEFASPVAALRAAVDIQSDLAARPLDLPPGCRMLFRIGINLGDVMVDGGELYGDGVNIAARLQTMAEPGGICISGSVHQHVEGKLPLRYDDLGSCEVKNIAKPVGVFRVRSDAPARATGTAKVGKASKPTIAVLPFVNLSSDPLQESFADSVTEDLITELARFRAFFVVARTSSFAYKERPIRARQVGLELGADFVVEGSVRRVGSSIRTTVQLIDTETGNHVWAERYDRPAEEAFALQDEVVAAIAGTLPQWLEEELAKQAERKVPADLSANDYLLMAERVSGDGTDVEDDIPALAALEKAIALDPACARAHAAMGLIYGYRHAVMGLAGHDNADKALACIERALALEQLDAAIHAYAAGIHLWCAQHELAQLHSERALALNPNDFEVIHWRAAVLLHLGDAEGGLEWYRRAERVDPLVSEGFLMGVFAALYLLKRYEEAVAVAKRISDWPAFFCVDVAACCAMAGAAEQARDAVAQFERTRAEDFDVAVYSRIAAAMCRRPTDREHMLEGYRKAGFPV